MSSLEGVDMSVLADRVAGQPGFDRAIEQFVTEGRTGKLTACVAASMADLIQEMQAELDRVIQEAKSGTT